MKHHLFMVMLTIALLLTVSVSTALATGQPPVLDEVVVYTSDAPPGESVTVGADAWAQDGVKSLELYFKDNLSGKELVLPMKETFGYGKAAENFSGILKLPDDTPEGDYTLYLAVLFDRNDVRSRYFCEADMKYDSPDAFLLENPPHFRVDKNAPVAPEEKIKAKEKPSAWSGDSQPPILLSVAVPGSRPYGRNTQYQIVVDATDDLSGIEHITIRFENQANGRTLSKVLTKDNLDGGVYSGWLEVNCYEPQGIFLLDNVSLTDNAGNYRAYCRKEDIGSKSKKLVLPSSASLRLDNGRRIADSTPPVVTSVKLGDSRFHVGSGILVTAEAKDDISGVDTVSVQFRNEDGKSISVVLTEDGESYTGWIKTFQSRKAGSYSLVRVSAIDRAGNRSTQPFALSASFKLEEN